MRKIKKLSSVSILIATASLLFALTPPVTEQAKEIKEVDITCEEVELAGLYTYEVDNSKDIDIKKEEIKEQEYIRDMKLMSTDKETQTVEMLAVDKKSELKETYEDMDTPSDNSFKSYMSYRCITDKSSKQYKFQQKSETGKYGIRVRNDRFCIAVGSYYTTKIGTKIDLVMKNGSIIECVLGDCKDDGDTDKSNRQNPNGSIVEFIVDMDELDNMASKMGDLSYCSEAFEGEIKYIRVYE